MKILQNLFITIICILSLGYADETLITEIDPEGYTIDTPGIYIFANDITWSPTSEATAITITASNVILNMKGFSLISTDPNLKTTAIAATASENVVIKQGTLQGMGLCGVQCSACANVTIKDMVVDGLSFEDIVNYTVPTGILTTACAGVTIHKCRVQNINVKTGSCAAIQLSETIGSVVSECTINNLLNRDGACTGIGHLLCDDALVKGCTISTLTSQFINNLNTEGHTTIGLVPVTTTNLKIENCTISDITGCCDDAHGISIFICDYAVVKNCQVFNVLDGAGDAGQGAKATGIEVYASHVKVIDCLAKNITAINPEDRQATGFSCALCSHVKFIRCKAENVNVYDQDGKQSACIGYGTGFGWAPDPRPEFIGAANKIHYEYCIAKNCQVGFDSWFHTNSTWDHITSAYNGISVLNEIHSQRTISCNPCSECGCTQTGCYPEPLTVTIENIATNNTFCHVKEKIKER